MLTYNIRGENIEVTPALRDYVESKVGKIQKYFNDEPEATAHVNLKTYSDHTAKVEVTVPLPQIVLRAEETSPDMYGSIDLVSDKLERQIRKYKTKIHRKFRRQEASAPQPIDPDLWGETESEESDEPRIVRTKQFDLKPMNAEEAVLQMDMLGHDFFVYRDGESDGIDIVYRRTDGDYGLIQTSAD